MLTWKKVNTCTVKQTFVNVNKAAWCDDIIVDLLHVIALYQLQELYDVINNCFEKCQFCLSVVINNILLT